MKKILYILTAFAIGLVSCSDEIEIPDVVPADCIVLNVFNSPMTKAITDLSGTEYERQLNRLDCFFYPKGQTEAPCVYYQKVEYDTPANRSASIPFYVDESVINTIFPSSDECDVFIIANLTSGTFAKGQTGTDVPTLSKTILTLGGERDAIDKPFMMAGLDIATKGDNNNASGTIPLHRAAAKITITVNIPAEIILDNGTPNLADDDVRMTPVLTAEEEVTLKTGFHNGVTKTYLRDDYSSKLVAADFYHTAAEDKAGYNYVETTPATSTSPVKYVYTCEVPFYSYARAWEKGAEDAAYLTLDLPWKNENTGTYQTYYYQILVNGVGRCFEPNNWYDLTVNVGMLGSTVESEPVTIKDLTYYILDWTTEPESETGDRYEDVEIQEYTYLVVPQTRLEINNATSGVLHFDASHKLGIQMNTSRKDVPSLDETTTLGAFYVDCGPDASGNTREPEVRSLNITKANFTIDNSTGEITYTFTIPNNVFSPVYVYATIWLDFDGDGTIDNNYPENYEGVKESDFTEEISIIQYRYSIYVNDIIKTGDGSGDLVRYPQTGNSYYGLGLVPGTNSTTGANPTYMYVVNVSSLKGTDGFYYNTDNNNNGPQLWYNYIIGDPRQRSNDTDLNDDGYDMDQHWVTAPDVNGNQRKLQNYYPTSTEAGNFQVIAPKFRIVSFHGNGHRYHNYEGAKMRCASYQEDGFPAGRWRLPTYAEIQFVIKLQEERVISPIFFGSSKYFTATNQVTYNANGSTYMNFQDNSPGTINGSNGSVRCVYDEWYWGSEREAQKNTSANPPAGEEYLFTWGDEKIW